MKPENVKRNYGMKLMLLAALLPGCSTTSPPSVVACPEVPLKPVVVQQTPLLPYSASARINISEWRKRLTDTQATPKH